MKPIYDINPLKGTLDSVTNANGEITAYVYNPYNDMLESVSKSSSSVRYLYENGLLTSIKPLVGIEYNYNFEYDAFGNAIKVNVGSQNLVTNTYKTV